jgi:hypothetical protein
MPKRIIFIEAEINRRLGAAVAADSPNRIAAHEVRDWARRYLACLEAEAANSPRWARKARRPHWNTWMRDGRLADALFAGLVFRRNSVAFFCGSGYSFDARRVWGMRKTNAGNVIALTAEAIPNTQPPLSVDRSAAVVWLGREWKP